MTTIYHYHSDKADQLRHKMQRHGYSKGKDGHIRLYQMWLGMRHRCDNPRNNCYKNYGGRGIRVCDEWQDYPAFREWALAHDYKEGLSIDRINTDGNYEPLNCRFVPISENQKRRTMNIYIICDNKAFTLTSLTKYLGEPPTGLRNKRKRKGLAYVLAQMEKRHGKKLKHSTLQEIESLGLEIV